MAAKPLPSTDYLRQCLDYNPETGLLAWKKRPREHFKTNRGWRNQNTRFAGNQAGWRNSGGWWQIEIDNVSHYVARIVWIMQTGIDPGVLDVDHHNRDKSDHRWNNLRLATRAQNTWNSGPRGDRGLPKGVVRRGRKFRAECQVAGRRFRSVPFATVEEASAAYLAFARQEHGEFFNPGEELK